MPGRHRLPVAVLRARGRSHYGEQELREREERELKVPFTENIEPPEYLTGERSRAEFSEIAEKLRTIGIFTELDVDCLAQYVMSRSLYVAYTGRILQMIRGGDVEEVARWQRLQSEAFKQCRARGNDMGLSITSRCKIQVPQVDSDEDYEL